MKCHLTTVIAILTSMMFFKDNILLAVNYATNSKINPTNIDWEKIDSQYKGTLTLNRVKHLLSMTMSCRNSPEKWLSLLMLILIRRKDLKSDGYLVGDGVCHLASILYWVAKDAGP